MIDLSLCTGAGVSYDDSLGRLSVTGFHGDYTGWYVRVKRDGVLVHYNPETGKLHGRSKGTYNPPQEWLDKMPDVAVQGELTFRDGDRFSELSGIARSHALPYEYWENIIIAAFDLPRVDAPYSVRAVTLDRMAEQGTLGPHIEVIPYRVATSNEDMIEITNAILDAGWEGAVLYNPNAPYASGKVGHMQKVVGMHREEAKIIGTAPGGGRLSAPAFVEKYGQAGIGGYLVETLAEPIITFAVGTGFSDWMRANPESIGTIVTIMHKGRNGKAGYVAPRQPVYCGVRPQQDM